MKAHLDSWYLKVSESLPHEFEAVSNWEGKNKENIDKSGIRGV